MRKVILSLLVMGSMFVGPAAVAQDPGLPDTAALVVSVRPEVGPPLQLKVQVDLYGYNDQNLVGLSEGISWVNPNLTMDSAKASSFITGLGNNIGPFFYEAGSIAITNANKRFLFSWTLLPFPPNTALPPVTSGRRLWASYYFTLSSWTVNDSIVFDTLTYSPATAFLFDPTAAAGDNYSPQWAGKVIVKDPSDVKPLSGPSLPTDYALHQNYPNPFNPSTEINFDVPAASHVTLSVYNVLGQSVTTLVDREMAAGRYSASWDGSTDGGVKTASGIYFYKLVAGDFTETKKMVMLK